MSQSQSPSEAAHLESERKPTDHISRIDYVRGGVANIVVEEDFEGVLVCEVQKQGLTSMRPLVPALPEGVEITDGKSPAGDKGLAILCRSNSTSEFSSPR